jgi:hypothetical protein
MTTPTVNCADARGGYNDRTRHIHFSGSQTKVFHFGAKIVYYAGGAIGQDATVCLPNHQSLWVWNDYSITPQTLAKVAASARQSVSRRNPYIWM